MPRVVGVAGARNHQQIFSERADLGYDFINTLGFVDRHDHGGGFHKAAAFQKLGICRVSVKDGSTLPSLLRNDRGIVARGAKADLNVIDFDRLRLHAPEVVYDLPSGGRRLIQKIDGYAATLVSGEVVSREGKETGKLPGRLVRGAKSGVMAQAAE